MTAPNTPCHWPGVSQSNATTSDWKFLLPFQGSGRPHPAARMPAGQVTRIHCQKSSKRDDDGMFSLAESRTRSRCETCITRTSTREANKSHPHSPQLLLSHVSHPVDGAPRMPPWTLRWALPPGRARPRSSHPPASTQNRRGLLQDTCDYVNNHLYIFSSPYHQSQHLSLRASTLAVISMIHLMALAGKSRRLLFRTTLPPESGCRDCPGSPSHGSKGLSSAKKNERALNHACSEFMQSRAQAHAEGLCLTGQGYGQRDTIRPQKMQIVSMGCTWSGPAKIARSSLVGTEISPPIIPKGKNLHR
jgi:hypothetical protein